MYSWSDSYFWKHLFCFEDFDNEDDIFIFSRNVQKSSASEILQLKKQIKMFHLPSQDSKLHSLWCWFLNSEFWQSTRMFFFLLDKMKLAQAQLSMLNLRTNWIIELLRSLSANINGFVLLILKLRQWESCFQIWKLTKF